MNISRIIQIVLTLIIVILIALLGWRFWYNQSEQKVGQTPSNQASSQDRPSQDVTQAGTTEKPVEETVQQEKAETKPEEKSEASVINDQALSPDETQKQSADTKPEEGTKNQEDSKKEETTKIDRTPIKAPTFQTLKIEPNGKVRMTGLGPVGWRIELRSFGQRIGAPLSPNQSGEWIFISKENLPPGRYKMKIIAIALGDKARLISDQLIYFEVAKEQNITPRVVRTENDKAPVIMQQQKGQPQTQQPAAQPTEEIKKPEPNKEPETNKDAEKEEKEAAAQPIKPNTAIDVINYTTRPDGKGELRLEGTGQAQSTIKISLDKKEFEQVVVGEEGTWAITKPIDLKNGTYNFSLAQIDKAGTVIIKDQRLYTLSILEKPRTEEKTQEIQSAEVKEEPVGEEKQKEDNQKPVDQIAQLIKEDEKKRKQAQKEKRVSQRVRKKRSQRKRRPRVIVVRHGDTLWDLALVYYRDGHRYRKIFRRNRHKIKDPNCIRPGQRLVLPRH